MKAIAQTLGVSRSAVQERLKGRSRPRGPYRKVNDAVALPLITALASARPTYGYRRITALLNRQMRESGAEPVNHKRVYRIMKANHFLLARKYEIRPDYGHEGKVVTMRSNLRWCSDGFEFHCWNGEVVRGAFIIDAHDREIISWRAVVNAEISGSEVRDIMLEAVEKRFGTYQASALIEMLTDNGSPNTARETRIFARQIGLKPCFTAEQRHLRSLRAYAQARLRPRLTAAGCCRNAGIDRDLDRGLQRLSPPIGPQHALTTQVSSGSGCNALRVSAEMGARSRSNC